MRSHSERGGALAAILVTLLVLTALAIAGLVVSGIYIAHNVHVEKTRTARGESVEVQTPFGSMRVRQDASFDPKRFGVPVYPGALRQEDSHKLASFQFDLGDAHKEFRVVAAEYVTDDSVEQVREYYRRQLPQWSVAEKHHGAIQIETSEDGQKRIVAIHRERHRTHIVLASVGEPAAN